MNLALESLDADGNPPESRLTSPQAAFSLITALINEDLEASADRAANDAMVNGEPPFPQAMLDDDGRSDAANLNFGDAAAMVEDACLSYVDLLDSPPTLMVVKTRFGDDNQRPVYEAVLGTEITNVIRSWPLFPIRTQKVIKEFTKHGVGFAIFQDDADFRFEGAGWSQVQVPRDTEPCEEAMQVAIGTVSFSISELYKKISCYNMDEDSEYCHWDVDAVKELLMNTHKNSKKPLYNNWEALESALKQNDIYFAAGSSEKIYLTHIWVREFSDKISHFIVPRDGTVIVNEQTGEEDRTCEKFLFRWIERYDEMSEAIIAFPYGIGDGTFHSIRGLAYKIFPFCQLSNQARNIGFDGAIDSAGTMIQLPDTSQSALDRLVMKKIGPNTIVPSGVNIVTRQFPDYTKTLIPILADLTNSMQRNTSSYALVDRSQGKKTAYQVQNESYKESALSNSALGLFYQSWGRTLTQMVKRLASRTYDVNDGGYKYHLKLKKALLEKGIPLEALYQIYDVVPVRGAGAGSPLIRQQNFNEAMQFLSFFDETGKYNIVRDKLSELLGAEQINRYMPEIGKNNRQPVDATIAQLENFAMMGGQVIQPLTECNHFIHAAMHLQKAEEIIGALEQDPSGLQSAVQVLQILIPHAQFHVEQMDTPNGQRADEVKNFKKMLQNLAQETIRLDNELQAALENQQKQQEAEAQRQADAQAAHIADLEQKVAQQPDQAAQKKLQEEIMAFQVRAQILQKEAEVKLQATQAQIAAKLQGKQAEMALKQLADTRID